MKEHRLHPKYFFAPSHTFDENTLVALREETSIRIISDTIALKPYRKNDFTFIPQISGHCVKMPLPGVYTFCLHPNTMNDAQFIQTERFLQEHGSEFISFNDLDLENLLGKDIISKLLSWAYFMRRKL